MLNNIQDENVLFLDIETVPQFASYGGMSERFKKLWDKKAKQFISGTETPSDVYNSAGLFPEFGKIVCISVGFVRQNNGVPELRIASFVGENEIKLLNDFANLMNMNYSSVRTHRLCAHNGKKFDFPFISKRMILNKIKLPKLIDTAKLKPWETPHLDTMTHWAFGNYKGNESLELLTACFNIDTPKGDINGSDVGRVFWEDNDLDRIAIYCEKDVVALVQVARSISNMEKLDDTQIVIVTRNTKN